MIIELYRDHYFKPDANYSIIKTSAAKALEFINSALHAQDQFFGKNSYTKDMIFYRDMLELLSSLDYVNGLKVISLSIDNEIYDLCRVIYFVVDGKEYMVDQQFLGVVKDGNILWCDLDFEVADKVLIIREYRDMFDDLIKEIKLELNEKNLFEQLHIAYEIEYN